MALIVATSLNATGVNLDKIIVTTPAKTSQTLQDITANVDIITSQEIEERGYKTISDALRTRAGISYTRNGGVGKSTSIMMRGQGQKQLLVLIDGVRYNDPTSLSGALLEHIMMENIQQIEIIKGAQSGIWGADASAGVINIITKKADKEGFSASVYGQYGSYNTRTFGFNTMFNQGDFDISLNAQRLSSDGFSAKVPENAKIKDFEDDGYENSSGDIKLGYHLTDKDKIETFFTIIDAKSDFDGYNQDAIKAANDSLSHGSTQNKLYGLNYQHFEAQSHIKLYFNKSDFSRTSISGRESKFDGSVDEFGLNSSWTYAQDSTLSAGIEHKKFKHKNSLAKSYNNTGVFLANLNTFNLLSEDETIFSQALRYDKFDDFDNKLTYKVGLKHIFEDMHDFWTSINYATAYNIPSLYQLYDGFSGNKDLNPEETKSFDATASYKGFSLTYFYNEIDELIAYKTTNFTTFAGAYFNVAGKSTFKGVEISFADTLEVADLAYSFNYTYLKAKDKEGKALSRRPKHSSNLTLDYYGLEDTHVGTQISYVGSRVKSQYDQNPTIDYDAYVLVDVTADYNLNSNLSLYLKIDNFLNKSYQSIAGYGTSERAFYAGFRYKLK